MSDLGIPVVVAINADTKVRDKAAREFSKVFLSNLVKGYCYKDAFESARNIVRTKSAFYCSYSCCCNHEHKPGCPEQKLIDELKSQKKSINIVHEKHMPKECKCNLPSNIHRDDCAFMLNRIVDDDFEYEFEDMVECTEEGYEGCVLYCCCSPEKAHDESMKFMMIPSEGDILLQKPFEGFQEGTVNIQNPPLDYSISTTIGRFGIIGRNIELFNIVKTLSSESDENIRLIHIFGHVGVGKTSIALNAAKYVYDRKVFEDGCIYISLTNKNLMGGRLASLICTELNWEIHSKEMLCKFISKYKILIIIDKSGKVGIDKELLNESLEFFIEHTVNPKFIVVTDNDTDIRLEKTKFKIGELQRRAAALLLLQCAKDYIEEIYQDVDKLSEHPIFDKISCNTSNIIRFSQSLRSSSDTLDSILNEWDKQDKLAKIHTPMKKKASDVTVEAWNKIFSRAYDFLRRDYETELTVLYTLCQLPGGALEEDFSKLFEAYIPNWREFINVLVRFEPLGLKNVDEESNSSIQEIENDLEHSNASDEELDAYWLVYSKYIKEIEQNSYS